MAAHSTQVPWLPQLPPSAPLAGKEASSLGMAAAVLDANDNNNSEQNHASGDAARPERERATGPGGPYAKLAKSGAPQSQHSQSPSNGNSGQDLDLDPLPQNRYHSSHSQQQQAPPHHHQHHPHRPSLHILHNPAKQAAYEASDASTPSRTRSTSSSNFTPPSTFPSATSRAHAIDGFDNLDNLDPTLIIDTPTALNLNTASRGQHVHVTNDVDANNGTRHDDSDNISAPDHVPFAQQLHPFYLYPSSQQQEDDLQYQQHDAALLSAPSPQPQSLLASPQLCIRSRSRRSGRSARTGRTGASSHSRSRNDSHSRRPSLEDGRPKDETTATETAEKVARATDEIEIGNNDELDHNHDRDHDHHDNDADNDDADAESLDSHALAWDQTCLRIAYLVSTMVTPSANVSVGGGEASEMARSASNPGVVNGANGANGVNGINSDTASVGAGTSEWQLLPEMLDHFVDLCTKGWHGVSEPNKKRRKIAQILHWQNEVSSYGEAAYCGCSDGSPIPNDSLITAAEPPSLQSGSTSTTSASVSISTASASGEVSSVANESSKCSHCAFVLTPKRPIVWVADPKDGADEIVFKKVRRANEGPGDSIRKAFKSFRGLVFSKKSKRSVSSPAGALTTNATLAASPSTLTPPLPTQSSPLSSSTPILDKATMARRAWNQWEEINSQRLRDESGESRALFFPQTAMYSVRDEGVEVPAKTPSVGGKPPGSMSPNATQAQAKDTKELAPLVGDMKAGVDHIDDEDDEYDPEDDVSQPHDANDPSAEQRRQREINARLRRAEKLLKKTNEIATTTAQAA